MQAMAGGELGKGMFEARLGRELIKCIETCACCGSRQKCEPMHYKIRFIVFLSFSKQIVRD